MNFIVKKSNELTVAEKQQICNLFFEVFEKKKTVEDFDKQFLGTFKGYSYHGLMIVDDTRIIGCYSTIPLEYSFYDSILTFALSVDTMILEEYRGNPFNLKKIANLVYEYLLQDGIIFVFGFPNDNVYLVRKKILKWIDIGTLDYYILPIRIGKIIKLLSSFNFLSQAFSQVLSIFLPAHTSLEQKKYEIDKINNQAFRDYRYALFEGEYTKINDSIGYFAYRIERYENILTAYLIDVYPMTKDRFDYSVKYMIKNESMIDAILFVGKIDFTPVGLFKVPKRFDPKTVYMAGKILDTTKIDNRVFNIQNWNVNLSNFDVV